MITQHVKTFLVGLLVAIPLICIVAIAFYFGRITVIAFLSLMLCGAIYGLGHSIRSARATGEGEGHD